MRAISSIAVDIGKDWQNISYSAKPYLSAMYCIDTLDHSYGLDDGRSVVRYFLANASAWRGEKARAIKSELNLMLKGA
jgi:hypothetical protein